MYINILMYVRTYACMCVYAPALNVAGLATVLVSTILYLAALSRVTKSVLATAIKRLRTGLTVDVSARGTIYQAVRRHMSVTLTKHRDTDYIYTTDPALSHDKCAQWNTHVGAQKLVYCTLRFIRHSARCNNFKRNQPSSLLQLIKQC